MNLLRKWRLETAAQNTMDVQRHGWRLRLHFLDIEAAAPGRECRRGRLARSAMSDLLAWNALDWTFLDAHRGPRERFDHLARPFRIGDPFGIEFVRTGRHTAIAVAGI